MARFTTRSPWAVRHGAWCLVSFMRSMQLYSRGLLDGYLKFFTPLGTSDTSWQGLDFQSLIGCGFNCLGTGRGDYVYPFSSTRSLWVLTCMLRQNHSVFCHWQRRV